MTQEQKKKKNINTPRHSARVAAVQALYQIEQSNVDATKAVSEMIESNFATTASEGYVKPDLTLFNQLVIESSINIKILDDIITPYLAENWKIERLATVMRMILRLAVFELKECLLIPKTVIINEYIEITKEFFPGGKETNFVNSLLDKVAHTLRTEKA
jgi:N utilization substance protein B